MASLSTDNLRQAGNLSWMPILKPKPLFREARLQHPTGHKGASLRNREMPGLGRGAETTFTSLRKEW